MCPIVWTSPSLVLSWCDYRHLLLSCITLQTLLFFLLFIPSNQHMLSDYSVKEWAFMWVWDVSQNIKQLLDPFSNLELSITIFWLYPTIIVHNLQLRKLGFMLSSVQLLSHVWLLATPWSVSHQASLSVTNSWSLLKLISIELVMPSSHLILCRPLLLLLPSVFPSVKVFSSESVLCIR